MFNVHELEIQNQKLLNALREVAKGEGAYSRDELAHARNTIENMLKIANKAINEHTERDSASAIEE